MTNRDIAEHLDAFFNEHGVEESSKVVSRFLLGIAHTANAEKIVFSDAIGSVVVQPCCVKQHLVN